MIILILYKFSKIKKKEMIIFSAEFPFLTVKHILNCFLGSSVTQGHVIELGILLNISIDIMETLRDK